MVYAVELYLVADVARVVQRLGHIGKQGIHLFARLEPLLLAVEHTFRVVQVFARTQADQAVVCFGILLFHEVHVVAAYQLDAVFLAEFLQLFVHL